jgi:hypothetical protein
MYLVVMVLAVMVLVVDLRGQKVFVDKNRFYIPGSGR